MEFFLMASTKFDRNDQPISNNITSWLKRETLTVRNALETASRHFDKNDAFDVHTFEAVYAQESSFGQTQGKPNSRGAAGGFQIRRSTAKGIGLRGDKSDDERLEINHASAAAAKLLKRSDHYFEKSKNLGEKVKTVGVKDPEEWKKFALAAYNAGDSRIAKAQKIAKESGENPADWKAVTKYLEDAGATKEQAEETRDYVEKIGDFEQKFAKNSKANSNVKFEKKNTATGGHWVTIHGRHIPIKDKQDAFLRFLFCSSPRPAGGRPQ